MRLTRCKQYVGSHRKAGFLAVAAIAIGSVIAFAAGTATRQANHWPAPTVKVAAHSGAEDARGFARVVKRVLPAVVNISSSRVVRTADPGEQMPNGQMQMDPFFRQFFGNEFFRHYHVPREQREKSLGSGVIVSPQGYILTNNHVVDHASEIMVTLSDKRQMKAKLVGADPRTDIAVLKIQGGNFPYLTLADSSKVQVGDIALAIGDPFGVGQTVTMGIVSATGRGNLGIEKVEDFIQTDAPINPGNSGGALIDDRGYLIGINTAILGNSGGNEGIGFAIPINLARHVMNQIVDHGRVERAYLGVLPQDVTPAIAKAFGARKAQGALVGEIAPNGPASHSDLKQGDIILSVNGKPTTDANQLRLQISMLTPGTTANMKVLRDGKEQQVAVKLGQFPSHEESASLNGSEPNGAARGFSVDDLTPDEARQMNLAPQTQGVIVTNVNPDSQAADAGLQSGDVVQQVDHHAVKNVQDFDRAVASAKPGNPLLLLVNRDGSTMFIAA